MAASDGLPCNSPTSGVKGSVVVTSDCRDGDGAGNASEGVTSDGGGRRYGFGPAPAAEVAELRTLPVGLNGKAEIILLPTGESDCDMA